MRSHRTIKAGKLPDGSGYQVSYEQGNSRKVQNFQASDGAQEAPPNAAGSFHAPDHHQALMDRLDSFLKEGQA